MKAKEHTSGMLCWLQKVGIEQVDFAVRQENGTMMWHRSLSIERLPLSWARAQNVRQAEVYLRPARHESWPLVFLDDVPRQLAICVSRKYAALAVETSPQGGCHLWLACRRALDESERARAQRWLAQRTGADRGSISGEHLGRLAGFKNWKRSGVWVNTVAASSLRRWDPTPALQSSDRGPKARRRGPTPQNSTGVDGVDVSPSGYEWGQICRLLESGADPGTVYQLLVARSRPRRGADAERYARRTVDRAVKHINAAPGR